MKSFLILCGFILAIGLPQATIAQNYDNITSKKWFILDEDPIPDALVYHEYKPEIEPRFRAVEHKPLEPPATMRHKIERLVFGIYTDVPPEYDQYGYEIRRFMAHIGGVAVMGDEGNLEGQLKNIKSAKKILREWKNTLNRDIKAIENEIEEKGAPSTERSLLKYNSKTVYGFVVDMSNWLNANQAVHEYLIKIGPYQYSYQDPVFSFVERKHMNAFRDKYLHRAAMLDIMIEKYPPFRTMIY